MGARARRRPFDRLRIAYTRPRIQPALVTPRAPTSYSENNADATAAAAAAAAAAAVNGATARLAAFSLPPPCTRVARSLQPPPIVNNQKATTTTMRDNDDCRLARTKTRAHARAQFGAAILLACGCARDWRRGTSRSSRFGGDVAAAADGLHLRACACARTRTDARLTQFLSPTRRRCRRHRHHSKSVISSVQSVRAGARARMISRCRRRRRRAPLSSTRWWRRQRRRASG